MFCSPSLYIPHILTILYFRSILSSLLISLYVLQKRYGEVVAEPAYLDGILKEGAERAEVIANATLENIQNAMGFLPRQRR